MFQGEYINNMDDKGRVSIPSSFREALRARYDDERFVIARDAFDDCLRAYPLQEWRRLLDKLSQQPVNNRAVRSFSRRVVSSAVEYAVDKQGRVLMPHSLREHAGLVKSVVFAGLTNCFEIWDEQRWKQELEDSTQILQEADLDF